MPGKHVLCEKPMAATLPDATAMVRAAKASGKILQIGLNPTFDPEAPIHKKKHSMQDYSVIFITPNLQAAGGAGTLDTTFIYKKTAGAGATVDIGVYNMHASLYAMGYSETRAGLRDY